MRLVLCYPVEQRHKDRIAAAAPGWEIVDAGQDHIAEELPTAEIYCGHAKVPVPWKETVAGGKLQWIQSSAAGMDHCLVPAVIESDIVVTSASGVLADQVAEHAVGLLTALCRSFPVFFGAKNKKEFIRRPTRDLTGSTVGIVGFGGVGRRLAELLRPYKTRLLATDWFPFDKPEYVEALFPADRLDSILSEVDFLVLCAPLTEVTRGMIDAATLAKLRPDAFLVNVARGPLVVETDLVGALESGHLAGAALDVTEKEPLPETSRLWDLPNVIITPHVAGQSARRIDNMTEFFCDNLRRFQADEPLKNFVDKRLGFPIRVREPV